MSCGQKLWKPAMFQCLHTHTHTRADGGELPSHRATRITQSYPHYCIPSTMHYYGGNGSIMGISNTNHHVNTVKPYYCSPSNNTINMEVSRHLKQSWHLFLHLEDQRKAGIVTLRREMIYLHLGVPRLYQPKHRCHFSFPWLPRRVHRPPTPPGTP